MSALPHGRRSAEVEAARVLLERLGIAPEELLSVPVRTNTVPTFDDYAERVANAVPAGSRQAYGPYWKKLRTVWGQRRLDEPTPLEISELAESTKASAVTRRNSRGGRSAAEHMIGALRCIYQHAVADGYLAAADNPALKVKKPRRLASTRRALQDEQLHEINQVAATTGNDPELDLLLLRLHEETACRRAGALALRPRDLDTAQCLICLREKGETVRWQPISPSLMETLTAHISERGFGNSDTPLFRYRNGTPITCRRYDSLWRRLGQQLPWVATQQVSTHWLRHTTLTWVERNFGYAIARDFAGHIGCNDAGTTATYVRASLYELARSCCSWL